MIDLRQQFFPVLSIDNEVSLLPLTRFMLTPTTLPATLTSEVPLTDFPLKPLTSVPLTSEVPLPQLPLIVPSELTAPDKQIQNTRSPISSPYLMNKCNGDVLFWSVYVGIFGLSNYHSVSHNLQRYEIEYKKKIIQQIQDDGKSFKLLNHKLTNINIQEMMSELSVSKTSTLLSVYAYATAYKQNIYIVYPNNTYMSILQSQSSATDYVIIYYINRHKCGFEQCTHPNMLTQLMQTHVAIETPENPLKSISNYKLPELVEIAERLHIPHEKMKKQELYSAVREHCYTKM